MFVCEKSICGYMDTIKRTISLIEANQTKIAELKTWKTPVGVSHRTITIVPGAIFGRYDGRSGLCEEQF